MQCATGWFVCAALLGAQPPTGTPGETPVIAALLAALHDPDVEIRAYVGAALATIGAPAVEPLRVMLTDADRFARAGSAYALGRMGGAAAPAKADLLKALSDADRDVRRQAAYAIGQILAGDRNAPPAPPPVFPPEPPR